MPNTVDRRIVEMRFDNKDFEKNIGKTMVSLESLEKALQMQNGQNGAEKVKKSLFGLGDAVKKVDTNNLAGNVEKISDRFSTLGIIGQAVLQNIGNRIATVAFDIKNKLLAPLNVIKQGGMTRALNLEQANFQIKGLGIEKNDTASAYTEVMDAVLGTAYSYDVAAKAASQLAASNVGVSEKTKVMLNGQKTTAKYFNGDMTKAILGIAGVASMTGSSFDDISQVFTRVAGQGKVMSNDLNSISSRGLNAAATLANYLGKTEAEVREMVTKGQIDFNTFSAAMTEAFGEHAKDSTKTFTGALEDVKAALSRIGADFFGPYLTASRDILNSFTPLVDLIHDRIQPALDFAGESMLKYSKKATGFIDTFSLAGNTLSDSLGNKLSPSLSVVKKGVSSLDDSMKVLKHGSDEVYTFLGKELNTTGEKAKKMAEEGAVSYTTWATALQKFVSSGKEGSDEVRNYLADLSSEMKRYENVADNLGITQAMMGSAFKRFAKIMGTDVNKVYEAVGEKVGKTGEELKKAVQDGTFSLTDFRGALVDLQKDGAITSEQFHQVIDIMDEFILTDSRLAGAISKFSTHFGKYFNDVFTAGKKIAELFRDALKGLFDVLSGGGGESALFALTKSTAQFVAFLARGITYLIDLGRTSGAFKKVHDVLLDVNNVLFGLIDHIAGGASDVFNFVKQTGIIQSIFSGLGKSLSFVTKSLTEIFAGFTNVGGKAMAKAGEAFGKIADALGRLKSGASGIKDALMPVIDVLSEIGGRASSGLAKTIGAIFEAFSGGISKLTSALGTGLLGAALYNLWHAFSTFATNFRKGGLIANLFGGNTWSLFRERIFDIQIAINGLTTGLHANLQAGTLMKMAIAIGVLAIACKTLSKIDSPSLLKSVAAIGAMFKMLIWGSAGFNGLNTKGFVKLAITISILTKAVKALSELNNLGAGIAGVGLLMAELVGISYSFKRLELNAKGLGKAGVGFILIAEALNIMSKPVARLAQLDTPGMVKGLAGVAIIMKGMIFFMESIAKTPMKNALAASFSMTVMAIALTAMVAPVALLGQLKVETLVKGLTSLVVMIGAITGAMILMGRFGKNALTISSIGPALVAMAKAINVMLPAILVFAMLPVSKLVKGIGAVTVILAAFAGFGVIMSKFALAAPMMLVASGALMITAVALNGIALAIAAMGNTEHVWKGIAALGVTLVTLAVGVTAMMFAAVGAPVLLVVAAALTVLAPALALLASVPFLGIVGGMVGLAVALGIFAGAATLLTPAMPAMLALSGVIALIGLGMAALGTGVTLLAVSFASGIGVIIEGCKQLAIGLPIIAQGVLDFIGVLLAGLKELAPQFASTFATLLSVLLVVAVQYTPAIIQIGLMLIIKLLEGIRSKISDITNIAIDIIILFVNTIGSRVQDVVDAGFNLMINFINGLADSIATNGPVLIDSIKNLVASVLEVIAGEIPIFGDYAAKAIANYRKSLDNGGEGAKKSAKKTSEGVEKNLKLSKDFDKNTKKSFDAIGKAVDTASKDTSKKSKKLADDANTNLKIKDQYSNGYNAISGLVSGMENQRSSVQAKANQIAAIVDETIRKKNEISSPSRLLARTGKYLMQGLIKGLDHMTPEYMAKANNIATTLIDSTNSAMSAMNSLNFPSMNLTSAISQSSDVNLRMNDLRRENDKLASGISQLTRTLDGMTESMNSRALNNYITVDGTGNPEEFADGLIRRFRLNARTV